jgi:hypothetical protein
MLHLACIFATYKVRPLLLLSNAVVGPGYYLKGPGQVAPCPRGEWKAGIGSDGNCTRCALGVTTLDIAASSELNCTSGSFAHSVRVMCSIPHCAFRP